MLFFARNEGVNKKCLDEKIPKLLTQGKIFKLDNFYSLDNNPNLIERRNKGNYNAKKMLEIAKKKSKFIARFPYVKAVFISGSLSKNYIDKDGDIDYFIVTKPNRLWIARTLLILYKKVFLFNSRKYFCVNYFVDEESLEIQEKNLFTATEIATILPMVGKDIYENFMKANTWTKEFYPVANSRNTGTISRLKKGVFSKSFQGVLNTKLGDFFDSYFMKKTLKRWQTKFKSYTPQEFELLFKTNKRTSKHHPSDFQKKVLTNYNNKLQEVLNRSNVNSHL